MTDIKNLDTTLANLDATNYRLNLLCNRFEKDKDLMLKEGTEIIKTVQTLQQELKMFAEMRGEIGKVLAKKIDEVSETVAQATREGVKGAIIDSIDKSVCKLEQVVNRSERKIEYFYYLDKTRLVWMSLGLTILPVVVGVLVGVIVGKIAMKMPLW